MKAGRELDLLVAQEIFNLTGEQAHCWPSTIAEFMEAKMPGYTLQPHEQRYPDGYYVWWECLRDGCANKIIEGQEPPMCYQTVKMYSSDISAAWDIAEKIGLMVIPVAVYPDEESWQANQKEKAETWWVAVPSDYDVYLPLESYQIEHGSLEWVEQRIPIYALAESAPYAICLAAVRVVGYDEKEGGSGGSRQGAG